jgi:transcription-repair coupling factor (superfamily II helicase)
MHLPFPSQSDSTQKIWNGINVEALAHQLSSHPHLNNQPVLIVCDSQYQAEQVETALHFFLNHSSQSILHFPDWETLPYDTFSPHQDIISQRLKCLYQLPQSEHNILITSINTLMQTVPAQEHILANSLHLEIHQIITPKKLCDQFSATGYNAVTTVYEHGEFSSRGSILDVYPMGSHAPIRIDFLDDEIDSLRYFDPDTQLSTQQVDAIKLLPAKEFPLNDDNIDYFIERWHEYFGDDRHCPVYLDVKNGIASPGLEYYLPLFFEKKHTLLDFLPSNTTIIYNKNCHHSSSTYWQEIKSRYDDRRYDTLRPILAPKDVFFSIEELLNQFKNFSRIQWDGEKLDNTYYNALPDLATEPNSNNPFEKLTECLLQHPNTPVFFTALSEGRRKAFSDLLAAHSIQYDYCDSWQDFTASSCSKLGISPITSGLIYQADAQSVIIISENCIFGKFSDTTRTNKDKNIHQETALRHISELQEGDPVVHIDHGVGRYRGLETLVIEHQDTELLRIEYSNNASLYVPVSALHLIHAYNTHDSDNVSLDRLGHDHWQKTKKKAAEKIHDVAVELLHTYAHRESRKGFAYSIDEQAYQQFSNSFPFTETQDQSTCIDAIKVDMSSDKPMDRLICGDVGFGKTEVAMRAAFIAAHAGKQIGILVPTTLLAQQHYENFKDRFADWPINIGLLSRFQTATQQKETKNELSSGNIDIIIGTHSLIQKSVVFKQLGLLIIDEEHRFGVRQKEKIKAIKSNVDILTLTATPIPRTLNMSLHELRDLSLMTTPPAKRLSIKTFVRAYDKPLIKEAILRELLRGGQVFYLHNHVSTMQLTVEELEELLPDARIVYAHGQMREKDLERIMSDFYHKKFNVLVCSTIIETGIDIPSANTIIVDRADQFGLAQLHQLRGRVGRSHHQAYAYLLTPSHGKITADAEKRLTAIQETSDLGAGFMLAQHDLEIRGAGELLGDEQSGQMSKIGFSLYMELLTETIESIKNKKAPQLNSLLNKGCEINLGICALIPDSYIADPHNRLLLYKRISNAKSKEAFKQLKIEMIDRFGLLPDAINNLFSVTNIKLRALKLGIDKITANTDTIQIVFSKTTSIDPIKLVTLVQDSPHLFKLTGSEKIQYTIHTSSAQQRIDHTHQLLNQLS